MQKKNLLIGLGALVAVLALATVAIIGKDSIMGALKGKDEIPTIMVVSPALLQQSSTTTEEKQKFADGVTPTGATASPQKAPATTQTSTKVVPGKPADGKTAPNPGDIDPRTAAEAQNESLKKLLAILEDSLGGRVAETLQKSGRFEVIPRPKVIDALDAYARSKNVSPASLMDAISGSIGVKADTQKGQIQGEEKAKGQILSHGLIEVANKAHAQYVLVFTTNEPSSTRDANGSTLQLTAQPLINVEIFETNGRMIGTYSQILNKPVRLDVTYTTDMPLKGAILSQLNKFDDMLGQVVSQTVLGWSLDVLFPAKIVRAGDKMMINRGTNDGLKSGQIYQVVREVRDTIRDGDNDKGPDLGKERDPVGSIVIDAPQDRISTVKTASGGPFMKGDFVQVLVAGNPAGAAAPSAASPGDVPLGSQALAQADAAKAGGATRLASIAVGNITTIVGGRETDSSVFAEALSAALAADPRIRMLDRAQLSTLRSERRLNSRASGDFGSGGDEGLAQSGYLINGRLTTTSSRHDNTVSAGGQTVVTSSTTSTSSSGTLTVLSMNDTVVASVPFTGNADAAARALLLKLFPMKVVQANGGTVVVDRGQDAGLKVGGRLQLYHLGKPIVNKQTGAILSEGARTLIGTATITDVQDHVATATVAGGVTVAEGDAAESATGGSAPKAAAGAGTAAATPARKAARAPQAAPEPAPSGIHF